MRGRKPSNLHIAVDAILEPPSPPSWLSKDAKAEWRRVAPLLVARGILTTGDLGCLEVYCVAIGTVRATERTLQTEGHTFVNEKGAVKRHPATSIQAEASNRARLLAAELGLTPVSRSRPSVRADRDDEAGDSPLDL